MDQLGNIALLEQSASIDHKDRLGSIDRKGQFVCLLP